MNPGTPGWRGTGELYQSDVRENPNFNSVSVARTERQRLERAIAAATASPIFFRKDSAVIQASDVALLQTLAVAMKAKNPSDPAIPISVNGFASSEGPLLRLRLLQLGPREHILFWTWHHIISDGWSIALFHRDLRVAYQAFCEGEENPLKRLEVQYADYAIWQRGWMQSEELKRLLGYWQRQLAGAQILADDSKRPVAVLLTKSVLGVK
jgi:hypothetical protein